MRYFWLHLNFRIICYFSDGKRVVIYKAPCGRSLRNMDEVHMYLRITKSSMTVDFFDYDFWVNVLAEFQIESYNYSIEVSCLRIDLIISAFQLVK